MQLHLVPPTAPFFNNRHVLLAAATRKVPLRTITVGIQGDILADVQEPV